MCAGHGAVNRGAKANREVTWGVQVSLRAVVTGSFSRTARVFMVRWNLKEAVSKTLVRGTKSAYDCLLCTAFFSEIICKLQICISEKAYDGRFKMDEYRKFFKLYNVECPISII